jgi:catechol 2,3-dioxygenase-like lactoylglutathione lyase family enzyme
MSDHGGSTPFTSGPELLSVEPTLFVTDFPRSMDFFCATLGFTANFTYGDPPYFGQVARDAALVNLRFVHRPVLDLGRESDPVCLSIRVSNVRQLFAEFDAAGAPFHQTLRRETWQPEDQGGFILRDPDGNLIFFVGRTD